MTTYFISGYGDFSVARERWNFFRVWETDDTLPPSQVIIDKITELENSLHNSHYGQRGEIIITAFNKV